MKVADLSRAQRIVADRDQADRMLARVQAGPVRLTVGDGKDMGAIDLSADYLAALTADVLAGLQSRIDNLNARLTEMGLEP